MNDRESFEDQVVARVRDWLARTVPRLERLDDATLTVVIRDTGHRSSTDWETVLAKAEFHEGCDVEAVMAPVGRAPAAPPPRDEERP